MKDKIKLRELLKDDATPEKFKTTNDEFDPDVILFYDHGSEEGLVAQGGESYVLDTKNVDGVAGKVIYSMACLSAKKLGVEAYKCGCVFVGYIQVFAFTPDDEQLFCEAVNSGFIAYVEGESNWGKIKQMMVEKFDEMIDKAIDPWTRVWLNHDKNALRVYNGETPETECIFRRFAIWLLGEKKGWEIHGKL